MITHGPKICPCVFLLLVGSVGCRTVPALVLAPVDAPVTPSPPIIRLCGHEIPPEVNAVQEEVLRHVSPGLPLETARTRMEELGFTCLYAGCSKKKPESYHPTRSLPEFIWGRETQKDKSFHTMRCTISANQIGNWGQRYFPIAVELPYDEDGRITELAVPHFSPITSRYAEFFAHRPELREPIGLSVRRTAMMQAQKFHCAYADAQGSDHRPYLDCYAHDEGLLSGKIVRVHLFCDDNQTVTEAEVVQKPGELDSLRCMLPNDSDTVTSGTVKAVVFPIRLYASLVVAGLLADLSINK